MTSVSFVDTVLSALQAVILAIAMMYTIKIKYPKTYLILSFVMICITYYCDAFGPESWGYIPKLSSILVTFLLPFACANVKRVKIFFFTAAYMIPPFLLEIIFSKPIVYFYKSFRNDLSIVLIFKTLTLILVSVSWYCVWWLLKYKVKLTEHSSDAYLFYLIPITQILMLTQIVPAAEEAGLRDRLPPMLILTLVCTIIADVLFFRAITKMQQNYLLQEQLHALEYRDSVQEEYYKRMESSISAANRIRHDINNQLQAAYLIFSSGEPERAKEQLQSLQHTLEREMGSTFCANKVVDAVMMDKFASCRQESFPVDVDIALPDSVPVDGVDLCSIFANLMDNAIHACRECKESGIEPWIQIKANIAAGCLVVRCENSASATLPNKVPQRNTKSSLARHGLGLEILQALSEKYNGDFSAVQGQKSFLVTISLIMAPMQNGTPGAVSSRHERTSVKQPQYL